MNIVLIIKKMLLYILQLGQKEIKKINQKRIFSLIEQENFECVKNENIQNVKTITFIIPGMKKYSGGRTSILRLGTSLSRRGYKINYISYLGQSVEEMQKIAKVNLESYEGTFFTKKEMMSVQTDVIVATDWRSVYFAKRCSGYKMYFIQDYEPYFHSYGDEFWLAKKTYQLGFHMVSLGAWNKYKIEKECNVGGIQVVDFPYEKSEYSYKKRDYSNFSEKRQYKMAVYIKEDGKRLPILTQIILKGLKELFKTQEKDLEIFFFGMSGKEKTIVGKNLGKLGKKDLERLYHEVDFGMVASMSNISLIPYEMIATGLPIIEFQDGTFPYFFEEGSAILTSFSYKELYEEVKKYIDNPIELVKMEQLAYKQLECLSWERTAEQFEKIIKDTCVR